ncbi:MAG: UDP-N-acetylmuramate--L-alanine ligase [Firmicutes bacterium]|nr:UDP-N-acetylmuramate--L-alanine ligase [Bacillota bacterium]
MKQQIHFIGIGGTGMGPLAKVFLEMGWQVSGSDLQPSETTRYLESLGAKITFYHSADNINGSTSVVYSSAIPENNPERLAAKERNIQIYHRSEMLAKLLNERRGIAVGGAHGKTTITSMIAWILDQSGVDPVVLIGARFAPFGPGAKYGKGTIAVAEADESDGSFTRYYPEVAIVTSMEADHLENYNGAFNELVCGYKQFLNNVKPNGIRILGIDDPEVRKIINLFSNVQSYGFSKDAYWCGEIVSFKELTSEFNVYRQGKFYGKFVLNVPGRYNTNNALAAIAACDWAGLSPEQIAKHLKTFTGAQRRFQIIGEKNGIIIVDDYAHHPTEIAATLQAAREGWNRRVIAVFQPHRFSRTHFLLDEFSKAFKDADLVVLTDIYAPPPEQPIPGVSSAVLAEMIRQQGKAVYLISNRQDIARHLAQIVKPNDLVITMGAGPIWQTALELNDLLH